MGLRFTHGGGSFPWGLSSRAAGGGEGGSCTCPGPAASAALALTTTSPSLAAGEAGGSGIPRTGVGLAWVCLV